jgi:hypothetical protein
MAERPLDELLAKEATLRACLPLFPLSIEHDTMLELSMMGKVS